MKMRGGMAIESRNKRMTIMAGLVVWGTPLGEYSRLDRGGGDHVGSARDTSAVGRGAMGPGWEQCGDCPPEDYPKGCKQWGLKGTGKILVLFIATHHLFSRGQGGRRGNSSHRHNNSPYNNNNFPHNNINRSHCTHHVNKTPCSSSSSSKFNNSWADRWVLDILTEGYVHGCMHWVLSGTMMGTYL